MEFKHAKALHARFDEKHRQATEELNETRRRLADEMGIPASGQMGLTPDAIKFNVEYQAAWKRERRAFSDMREFNKHYTRAFKRELREERNAKRKEIGKG